MSRKNKLLEFLKKNPAWELEISQDIWTDEADPTSQMSYKCRAGLYLKGTTEFIYLGESDTLTSSGKAETAALEQLYLSLAGRMGFDPDEGRIPSDQASLIKGWFGDRNFEQPLGELNNLGGLVSVVPKVEYSVSASPNCKIAFSIGATNITGEADGAKQLSLIHI